MSSPCPQCPLWRIYFSVVSILNVLFAVSLSGTLPSLTTISCGARRRLHADHGFIFGTHLEPLRDFSSGIFDDHRDFGAGGTIKPIGKRAEAPLYQRHF